MANEIKALNIGGTTYDIKPEFADNAGKVNSPLKAGTKSYNGSAEVTITASDLGLSSALKYIGKTSTSINDGSSTTSLTINGSTYTIPEGSSGQVVFYDEKEFVWNGSTWEFLGDDRNFKVIQSPVSDPAVDDATSTTFIDAISQDANGLITATKKKLPSYLSTSGGTIEGLFNIKATVGQFNVYNPSQSTSVVHFYAISNGANKDLGYLGCDVTNGPIYMESGGTQRTLLHSGNYSSYALPLSGGTITYEGDSGVKLSSKTLSSNYLWFEGIVNGSKVNLGALGMRGYNNPAYVSPTGFVYGILHEGNIREYKAGGLAHSNGTVGAVVSSYGTLTIGASDKAGDGSKLYIDNNLRANSIQIGTTYTEGLNRATLALNPNLTTNAVHGVAHVFGADLSTCNAGNIVFRNIGGAGSVKNIVSIGLYGKDDILCCNGNGNVLIGTTEDSGAKLQVNGNYRSISAYKQTEQIEHSVLIYPENPFGLITRISTKGYASLQSQRENGSETFNLALNPLGGNVLIGTTTDSGSKLQVNGNTTITGTCSASSGFFETSDSRLKDFKDPVKVDLDKLSKLTKAYFTFKNDPEKMHLGVSAQEIQEIYPEIVNENEEGFLSVDYAKLSVIALTAVDELNNRLNSIEERLSKLEK